MDIFQRRPDWLALAYQRGLAALVAWKLIEGLLLERARLYSGDFYPWRRVWPEEVQLGAAHWHVLLVLQAALLALWVARRWTRAVGVALAAVIFVDALASFQNHRLLLAIQVACASAVPVPRASPGEQRVHWGLDLIRIQVVLVYAVAGIQKLNPNFLGGDALRNLFRTLSADGLAHYPQLLAATLDVPVVATGLAVATVLVELALPIALVKERLRPWAFLVAAGMHVAFSALIPFIWHFTAQMLLAQLAFIPTRSVPGVYRLERGDRWRGPRLLLRLMPRTVVEHPASVEGWRLVTPDGRVLVRDEAWLELLALGPWTVWAGEVLRIAPLRRMLRA